MPEGVRSSAFRNHGLELRRPSSRPMMTERNSDDEGLMPEFDKARFVESTIAAILGAGAYGYLSQSNGVPENSGKSAKKFQRSLILATNFDGFDEDVVKRYLKRIANLEPHQRERYTSFVLQPPDGPFDERETSVVIFDHALKDDEEWALFLRAFRFDEPSTISQWTKALRLENEKSIARQENGEYLPIFVKPFWLLKRWISRKMGFR